MTFLLPPGIKGLMECIILPFSLSQSLSTFSCRFCFFSCHFSSVFHMFWYVIIIYFACRNYQRERDCLDILLKISELSRTAFLSFSLLVGLTILDNFVFYKASLTMNNVNIWNSHHILKVPFMF